MIGHEKGIEEMNNVCDGQLPHFDYDEARQWTFFYKLIIKSVEQLWITYNSMEKANFSVITKRNFFLTNTQIFSECNAPKTYGFTVSVTKYGKDALNI